MQNKRLEEESPVLLVCIYNQYGNIITHDYLYQLFNPYGNVVKMLIFEKAKVWKTFVEYDDPESARKAQINLNNKVIFEDGSKMNIFRSKLKHIQLQNSNLGGVNYEDLKEQQMLTQNYMVGQNRPRRGTFQDHIESSFSKEEMAESCHTFTGKKDHDTSSTKFKSDFSATKSFKSGSFNNFGDIDEQFREIALESEEFREWEEIEQINRRKSKTIFNPNSQQFLMENRPSKVLFIRSIPQAYDNVCIFNIFANFGKICKVIFIKEKQSALIEFEVLMDAIQAKDQINYAKSEFKVFYSHYESLVLKKVTEDEEEFEYKSQTQSKNSASGFNPPTETLYITMAHPNHEEEIRNMCKAINCPIKDMEWRQNGRDKWMCLAEFKNLASSLYAMAKLQGKLLSSNKKMKLSFTRSKLKKKEKSPKFYHEEICEKVEYNYIEK